MDDYHFLNNINLILSNLFLGQTILKR